jgi:transposase-like protein
MATNLIEISKNYNTQLKCLKLLENIRWGKVVKCPNCGSDETRNAKGEMGRHACRKCLKTFSVFSDTIFEDTRLSLPKWFMAIAIFLNGKGGVSAKELQRSLGTTYKTSYYLLMRLRVGMLLPETKLHGILEMDESYFGGKPRKRNLPDNVPILARVDNKRGRGTKKISVAGIVERKGSVKVKVIEKLSKRNLLNMIKNAVIEDDSVLITDEFKSYKNLSEYIEHLQVNHSKAYSKGLTHTNTIEGFWSYVKNGIKGSYKAISRKYLPFYLIEYEWHYNHRNDNSQFMSFLKNAMFQEKELLYWKAESKEQVTKVAYE